MGFDLARFLSVPMVIVSLMLGFHENFAINTTIG